MKLALSSDFPDVDTLVHRMVSRYSLASAITVNTDSLANAHSELVDEI